MSLPLILIAAYGRRYGTAKAALADWEAGKDFRIDGGPYTSIRDIKAIIEQHGGANIYWNYPSGESFVAQDLKESHYE
jgi:hypothetical protein